MVYQIVYQYRIYIKITMSNANETGKNVADTMDVSITVDDEKVKTTDVELN